MPGRLQGFAALSSAGMTLCGINPIYQRTVSMAEVILKDPARPDDVVIDQARSQLSDLWKKEDYWAIWLGFIILAAVLAALFGFGLKVMGKHFGRFVLGFIAASIIFSLISGTLGNDVGNAVLDHGVLRGFTRELREWFFALAFASIGLATNFKELAKYFKGGKPVILYVCGQSFNLALTLGMAHVMFYLVFPEITARI
jgi:hypothetical protein